MRIFLAGGISGNLREFWQKVMKVYCASPNSRKEVIEAMNSFLAGDKDKIMRESIYGADFFVGDGDSTLSGINVLESYYYLRKNEDFMPLVRHFGSFLLDSGAYTFMAGSHKGGEKHCGKCGTCVERKEALRDAGIEDTTEYETE